MGASRDPGLKEVEDYLGTQVDRDQYDPYQDEETRRELRKRYRNLHEETLGKFA
jgi:hypothetical protein